MIIVGEYYQEKKATPLAFLTVVVVVSILFTIDFFLNDFSLFVGLLVSNFLTVLSYINVLFPTTSEQKRFWNYPYIWIIIL